MRTLVSALVFACVVSSTSLAQFTFDPEIEPAYDSPKVVFPASPLKNQILFIGGYDSVATVDANGKPNGKTLAKQWNDFIGFTPDNSGSGDLGWISVNHEMIFADDKIGDGGGMTVFKVRRDPVTDTLIVVDQNLQDGREGKFFNVEFASIVGETGMNCGGINGPDGRIWTAEEWYRSNNESIALNRNLPAVRDTSDYTISSDIPGDFNGKTVPKYQNFNWMVEIDPKQAKAIRKQYNWGRAGFEGGAILDDNRTVILGIDDTPAPFAKFVADTPGDFTQGKLYLYKQKPNSYAGEWFEIANTSFDDMEEMLREAFAKGATGFARIEWVAVDRATGKVYMTETGRDNAGERLLHAIDGGSKFTGGGTIAYHHTVRAQQKGVEMAALPDFYGRVLEYDPATEEVKPYISGGPDLADGTTLENYPNKHLSNPDGLNFLTVGDKRFMLICEDLNGSSMGRIPDGVETRTCELFLLDMDKEPIVDNLVRIAVVPARAEITGAIGLPDGKTILVNSQHPSSDNPFPYSNSLTFAITGWDKLITSVEETPDVDVNSNVFQIFPNPATREIRFNKTTDIAIYDAMGKRVSVYRNTDAVDVSRLATGRYYVQTKEGETQTLIIE